MGHRWVPVFTCELFWRVLALHQVTGPRLGLTHNIYAVRRVYSAGAHPVASPPSPVSHRLASASLAVSEPDPSNPTPPSLPPNQLAQVARGGGAYSIPPEWRKYGRHGACVAHKKLSLPLPPSPSPSPTPALPRQRGGGDRLFPCPCHRRRRPSSAHYYQPVTSGASIE